MKNNFIIAFTALVLSFASCTSSSTEGTDLPQDPYEIMHKAFVGSPTVEEIKPLIDNVMDTYKFPKTDDNKLKLGNMLVVLRQSSAVGVTEMDIIKHMNSFGSNKITLAEQAGLSATLLETGK